ncbi:hypothetical protein [Nocardia sp. NPDC052566]|uniref:hypothetical protein n=1 Tax=Nocardia sp. NPDC052566 TaxID=3364330 RepID=UPI0037C6C03C
MTHASTTQVRSITATNRRSGSPKKGRPSKGQRRVVYTRLFKQDATKVNTLAEKYAPIAEANKLDPSDATAALALIGCRKEFRAEFRTCFKQLMRNAEPSGQSTLPLSIEVDDNQTAPTEIVWTRMPRPVVAEIGALEVALKKQRIRAYISGAFVMVGLKHRDQLESAFRELRRLADGHELADGHNLDLDEVLLAM